MDEQYKPFLRSIITNPKGNYAESKYRYALQNIVFYAIHDDETILSYYKDSFIRMSGDASSILDYIQQEYGEMDFHIRYWKLREFVAEVKRLDPDSKLSFTQQTYTDLMDDISNVDNMIDAISTSKDD